MEWLRQKFGEERWRVLQGKARLIHEQTQLGVCMCVKGNSGCWDDSLSPREVMLKSR